MRSSTVGVIFGPLGRLTLVLAVGLLAVSFGCGDDPTPTVPSGNGDPKPPGPSVVVPIAVEPPPAQTIPAVALTAEHEATLLVKVGDTMPQANLVDFSGQSHPLAQFHGPRLSVVCFWRGGQTAHAKAAAIDMFEFLALDVAEPFAEQGVGVVGVNVGDSPQVAQGPIIGSGATFANLLDPQGALFGQIATEKLPRFYLLDPQGKILWFDIEYSEATRSALILAIKVALSEPQAP